MNRGVYESTMFAHYVYKHKYKYKYIYMVPPPQKKKNLLFSWAKEVLYIWQKYAASPGDVSADGSGTKEPEVALKCGFSTAPGCFIKRPTFHHCKQRM